MPFGEYEDFDDCVQKNKDKEDPEAYCATIKRKIEGKAMAEDDESKKKQEEVEQKEADEKKEDEKEVEQKEDDEKKEDKKEEVVEEKEDANDAVPHKDEYNDHDEDNQPVIDPLGLVGKQYSDELKGRYNFR